MDDLAQCDVRGCDKDATKHLMSDHIDALNRIDTLVHEATLAISEPSVHDHMRAWMMGDREPTAESYAWAMESLWDVARIASELAIAVLDVLVPILPNTPHE